MIITLTGVTTGIVADFRNYQSYQQTYGVRNSYVPSAYRPNVAETISFIFSSIAGFDDNFAITSYSEVGVGQQGINWRGSYNGPKIITINFYNVFEGKDYSENGFTPNDLLNILVTTPNEIIRVTVDNEEGQTYQMDMHSRDETHTEDNTLTLESVAPDQGTFWYTGEKNVFEYFYDQYPLIPKNLPQVLLDNSWYPYTKNIVSEVPTTLGITIGGQTHGTWQKCRVISNRGWEWIFDNGKPFKGYLTVDSRADYKGSIVVDSVTGTSTDATSKITVVEGHDQYIELKSGYNIFTVYIDNYKYTYDLTTLPTDQSISFNYSGYTASIGNEVSCV